MNLDLFADVIASGKLDNRLNTIIGIVQERQDEIARRRFCLVAGDKVRILTPTMRCLHSKVGTVRKVHNLAVAVDLDQPAGNFHNNVVIPVNFVEKI